MFRLTDPQARTGPRQWLESVGLGADGLERCGSGEDEDEGEGGMVARVGWFHHTGLSGGNSRHRHHVLVGCGF